MTTQIKRLPSYAKILLDGFSQKRGSALLRSEMESGPPRQSRIKTRVMVTRSVIIRLANLDEFNQFEQWYSDEINEGASWFEFDDPVSQTSKAARFVDGGYSASPVGDVAMGWKISAQIETWG